MWLLSGGMGCPLHVASGSDLCLPVATCGCCPEAQDAPFTWSLGVACVSLWPRVAAVPRHGVPLSRGLLSRGLCHPVPHHGQMLMWWKETPGGAVFYSVINPTLA